MASILKNIVTFGAAGRIEAEHEKLLEHQRQLEALHQHAEGCRARANAQLKQLVEKKLAGLKALRRIREISKNLSVRDREVGEASFGSEVAHLSSLAHVERTLSAGETALNAAKGLGVGASTALGAWALVSTYGAASTGTAIASLSGAAATNATLAWFGGGAIAAGGGGMAAGAAAVGGIVAVPALIMLAAFNHLSASKKIKALKEESLRLIDAQEQCQKAILVLELATKRAYEIEAATDKANEVFQTEFRKIKHRLFRFGVFSKLWRRVRQMLGGKYYTDMDVREIAYLGQAASSFARILDLKVFDAHGEVAQGDEA